MDQSLEKNTISFASIFLIEKNDIKFSSPAFPELNCYLEIIERYEGVAQVRNLDNTSLTAPRRSSMIGELPGLSHRRKTVTKGLGTEFIMSQMSDKGIRKVFDQCSDAFFIAVEEELGWFLRVSFQMVKHIILKLSLDSFMLNHLN